MKIDGSCLCGHITYEAEVNPEKVAICHCTDCQTHSGTAFGVVVGVVKGNFELQTGNLKNYKKIAESDWRAVGDRTLPDAWKTYRQQLRDLPNSLPTNKKPKLVWDNNEMCYVISNVTWPTAPSA